MKPKIADVAAAVGVSRTLVSFAFNQPDRVSPATRDRILVVATELGYVPDPVARSMSSGRTGTIGILVPQRLATVAANPFFSVLLTGIASVAEPLEFPLLLVSPHQGSMERAISGAAVDGFLTVGLEEFRPTIQMLEARDLPYVMVDSEPTPGVACVNTDDVRGAYESMRAVLEAGHRHIGLVGIESPPPHDWHRYSGTLRRRVAGYRRALGEAGLDIDGITLVECEVSQRGGRLAAARLLEIEPRLTVIVAMSDVAAVGVLEEIAARGCRVPDDVSVVGFDGISNVHLPGLVLTTVSQHPEVKGRVATELLAGLIDGSRIAEHVVLPTSFVPGSTLASPPLTPRRVRAASRTRRPT